MRNLQRFMNVELQQEEEQESLKRGRMSNYDEI